MKLNRSVDLQRLVAVVLSSSLVWSTSAPAFAGVERSAPVTGVPAVSAAPVLPVSNIAAPTLPSAPALPALVVPAALPQAPVAALPLPAGAVAARPAALPAAPAQAQGAAAPKSLLGRLAARLAPASPNGAPSEPPASGPSFNSDGQTALYDNAAKASGGSAVGADAVAAEDWTASPAVTPLTTLKPVWREAERPSAPELRQQLAKPEVSEPINEKDAAIGEKLPMHEAKGALKDLSGDEEKMAFGLRERYAAEGAGQAVLAGDVLAWIDGDGKVLVYDRRDRNTVRVEAPMGKAEKLVASQDGKYLYVLAGGHVQRWDLQARETYVLLDEKLLDGGVLEISAPKFPGGDGQAVDIRTPAGHLIWTPGALALSKTGSESISAAAGAAPSLRSAGDGLYLESRGGSTRLWGRQFAADGAKLSDLGTVPADLKAVVALADRKTVFGLTDGGFIEWDLVSGRYRSFAVDGLRSAFGSRSSIDVSPDGRRVLIATGEQLFFADLSARPNGMSDAEAETRAWSDAHPMFIKGSDLHIGDFTFPVKSTYEPVKESWLARVWRTYVTRRPAPRGKLVPPVTREQWAALNLPSNKKALYQTLKGFSLGQNVLYIGETGGGKTWMSSTLSKLIGRKLYMVSFTEYTKNQDLLYSRTFGEEAKGKTGKTLETVLQWLNDPEGGILLLDEMHKPLEGIAALNNVLQNLSYHFGGKDIKGDRSTHFVIGTMNPVKPPYKGEPPSGELSSRFGTTVQVNYLPPAEEAALMSIFYPGAPEEINRKLVAIAKELRRIYPDVLPLPISSRTLLYIAEHIARFPGDDAVEIFKTTYNPGTIVEDPSIVEAIDKALRAHDLKGVSSKKG